MVKQKKVVEMEKPEVVLPPPSKKWEAAILNLNGLGLGYIHLHQWKRWGIHFGATIFLLVIATLLKASHMPWLWIPLWFIWIGWMTVDGWLHGRLVIQTKNRIIGLTILSLGVIVFEIFIWVASLLITTSLFNDGVKAFKNNDYESTLTKMSVVSNVFQLTFSPSIKNAEVMRNQSALLIFGRESLINPGFKDSVEAYTSFIGLYPDSEKVDTAKEQLAKVYHQWAFSLNKEDDYEEADAKYGILLDKYPDSAEIEKAKSEIGQMYMEWAQTLRKSGDFEDAIKKYLGIQMEYGSSVALNTLSEAIAEAHTEWGDQLHKQGDYETAQQKYEIAVKDHANTAAAKIAYGKAATNLLTWGEGSYQLGEYERSVHSYQKILDEYPESSSAVKAGEQLPDAMLEWIKQLYTKQDYQETAEMAQKLINDYPDAEQTSQAREILPEALIGWGLQLSKESHFILALEKFSLAEVETDDKELVASAKDEYQITLLALANDTGVDGQTVIRQASTDACAGIKTSALGINLLKDQPGKAISCDTTMTLPSDMLPSIPGTFRYVITRSDYQTTVQRCPYTGGHTLVREIYKVEVTLVSTVTGQAVKRQIFSGSSPSSCPYSRIFHSMVDYVYGGSVSEEDIMDWLINAVIH